MWIAILATAALARFFWLSPWPASLQAWANFNTSSAARRPFTPINDRAAGAAENEFMSKTRKAERQMIAYRAVQRLHSGEAAIDEALHELGLMCAELPKMRREASLSAIVGQGLFDSAGKAYAAQAEARRHMVDLHNGLEEVRRQFGLTPVTAAGGTDKPPTDEGVTSVAA